MKRVRFQHQQSWVRPVCPSAEETPSETHQPLPLLNSSIHQLLFVLWARGFKCQVLPWSYQCSVLMATCHQHATTDNTLYCLSPSAPGGGGGGYRPQTLGYRNLRLLNPGTVTCSLTGKVGTQHPPPPHGLGCSEALLTTDCPAVGTRLRLTVLPPRSVFLANRGLLEM